MQIQPPRKTSVLICLLLLPALGNAQEGPNTLGPWPGTKSAWNGFDRYDFTVDSRPAYVVVPEEPAKGAPWVWRARFPGYHDEIDKVLVKAGFHIARINTDGMLGSPRAMKHWDAFYQFVTERGLAERPALEGVSRGGLFVYGFASRWPDRVACIYCDTPVGDIRSWPGGKGTGRGDAATWKKCLTEYGLTEETAKEFSGSPIDSLASIAAAKIPLMHIVSMNDTVVPPAENTLLLAERYRKLGGSIEVIKIKTGTDQSHGHHFPLPDPQRMADFIVRNASTTP
jgi:pimeloyl-ACP methyl ester carboxylesterase